jgi:hypothetical protein
MDRRHADYVGHAFLKMTRARIYGVLADCADQNDHDVLRSEPICTPICVGLSMAKAWRANPACRDLLLSEKSSGMSG